MKPEDTTSKPATGASVDGLTPEFTDHRGVTRLFGICRSKAYQMADQGLIRSVSLRRPGQTKGKRLFDIASIRACIARCMEEQERGDEWDA